MSPLANVKKKILSNNAQALHLRLAGFFGQECLQGGYCDEESRSQSGAGQKGGDGEKGRPRRLAAPGCSEKVVVRIDFQPSPVEQVEAGRDPVDAARALATGDDAEQAWL